MRAYLMLYQTDFETDDDRGMSGKSSVTECRAFTLLASVCSCWRQTLIGWPQSSTRLWVRHQLKKLIEREYRYWVMCHQLQNVDTYSIRYLCSWPCWELWEYYWVGYKVPYVLPSIHFFVVLQLSILPNPTLLSKLPASPL